MKIGILTYPLNYNYGNLMQAYALMTYLKQGGFNVELIDKRKVKPSNIEMVVSFVKNIVSIILKRFLFHRYIHFYIKKGIDSFIKNSIKPKTNKLFNEKQIIKIVKENNYDCIIVGSDQIWRYEYIGNNIELYLLSFVDERTKKIAYSASFGVDYWQFDKEYSIKIKELLNQFIGVSVREDSAVKLLKDNVNIKAIHTLDPALLLSKEDYFSIAINGKYDIKTNYLFSYILDENDDYKKIVDVVIKNYNIDSRFSFSLSSIKYNNDQVFLSRPVETWLYTFYNSSFVITDSYHGTIFSILFNKPFIVIPNVERGLTRFTSLLKTFGLEERILYSFNDIDRILENEINWTEINSKLIIKREQSSSFILNSIIGL